MAGATHRKWIARGGLILVALTLLASCSRREIEAPSRPAAKAPKSQARLAGIAFTIQVGAFSTSQRAARYADQLEAGGLDAYYFVDRDGLWKVRFGRFSSKAAARRHGDSLRSRGVIEDYYIVSPTRASTAAQRDDLVSTARRFIGTPYRWGGTTQKSGFDCSGLTMTVYRLNGLELPRTASAQYKTGYTVPQSSLAAGDLVFFRTGSSQRVSHVGLYAGDGRFIHAPGRGKRIRTASINSSYFAARFAGARRYF